MGTRWYRAYFTADFVWHTALTAELGRYDSPPRNPYMASQALHYYWTYYLSRRWRLETTSRACSKRTRCCRLPC